jgi:hypothetical protein
MASGSTDAALDGRLTPSPWTSWWLVLRVRYLIGKDAVKCSIVVTVAGSVTDPANPNCSAVPMPNQMPFAGAPTHVRRPSVPSVLTGRGIASARRQAHLMGDRERIAKRGSGVAENSTSRGDAVAIQVRRRGGSVAAANSRGQCFESKTAIMLNSSSP